MTTIDESIERADGGILNITVVVQQPVPVSPPWSGWDLAGIVFWVCPSIIIACLGGWVAGLAFFAFVPLVIGTGFVAYKAGTGACMIAGVAVPIALEALLGLILAVFRSPAAVGSLVLAGLIGGGIYLRLLIVLSIITILVARYIFGGAKTPSGPPASVSYHAGPPATIYRESDFEAWRTGVKPPQIERTYYGLPRTK